MLFRSKRACVLDKRQTHREMGTQNQGSSSNYEEDSPATEGAIMTYLVHPTLQSKTQLNILTAISSALFVKVDSGTFEVVRECAKTDCRSNTLEFSVEIINGLRVSRNGRYCSKGCRMSDKK